MKLALVGVGGAGGRLVEHLRRVETETDRVFSSDNVLAFDTAKSAFEQYTHIPLDRHVLIGDTHPAIQGQGLDGDVDLGVRVAQEDMDEIHREFDKLNIPVVDAIVVAAGLGGGTGGGIGPVLLENIVSVTEKPVYAVGVLPDGGESDQVAVNAARSLPSFVERADNFLTFDNDAWHTSNSEQSLEESYETLNDKLAMRLATLLGTGELESSPIAESMVDSSDLQKALATGGVSSIGYSAIELETGGLLDRLFGLFGNGTSTDVETDAMRIKNLIQSAATSELSLPCSIASADRVLVVLSGPPEACSRKGFEGARHWLEQEADTVELFAGDEPHPGAKSVSATVLLSNATDVPRIEQLQERATAVTKSERQRSRPEQTEHDPPGGHRSNPR